MDVFLLINKGQFIIGVFHRELGRWRVGSLLGLRLERIVDDFP